MNKARKEYLECVANIEEWKNDNSTEIAEFLEYVNKVHHKVIRRNFTETLKNVKDPVGLTMVMIIYESLEDWYETINDFKRNDSILVYCSMKKNIQSGRYLIQHAISEEKSNKLCNLNQKIYLKISDSWIENLPKMIETIEKYYKPRSRILREAYEEHEVMYEKVQKTHDFLPDYYISYNSLLIKVLKEFEMVCSSKQCFSNKLLNRLWHPDVTWPSFETIYKSLNNSDLPLSPINTRDNTTNVMVLKQFFTDITCKKNLTAVDKLETLYEEFFDELMFLTTNDKQLKSSRVKVIRKLESSTENHKKLRYKDLSLFERGLSSKENENILLEFEEELPSSSLMVTFSFTTILFLSFFYLCLLFF